ncbi:MAG: cytochrome C551 [Actinobacteria bacterium HGW-Actinobacteria-10]|nr:MAG: cytochrome C551 [Actinobacteria bacterium HGW-Actinobacteria-10]
MTRFENDNADTHPAMLELEPDEYAWCQCGRTKTVPWCDGSHEGTGIEPQTFVVQEKSTVAICNCGLTDTPPFCDGSHAEIE